MIEKKDSKKREERRKTKVAAKAGLPIESRYIPIATRDTIFVKDEVRSSFIGVDGRRCTATHGLEIEHLKPWAMGGTHEKENLKGVV